MHIIKYVNPKQLKSQLVQKYTYMYQLITTDFTKRHLVEYHLRGLDWNSVEMFTSSYLSIFFSVSLQGKLN